MTQIEGPNILDYAEDETKANIEPMHVDKKGNLLSSGNFLGDLLQAPKSTVV